MDSIHVSRGRALAAALTLAVALTTGGAVASDGPVAEAACGVRFVASNWDPAGNENYMPQLNNEWVKIKNTCATAKSIGGWKISDYKSYHVYRFASTVKISAGATITLRSGKGTNTASTRYWGYGYGAVWNNTGTEKATLKNSSGTTVHSWVQAGW